MLEMQDDDDLIKVRIMDEFDDLENELSEEEGEEIRVDSSDVRTEASEIAIRAIRQGAEIGGELPVVRKIAIMLIMAGSLLGLLFGVLLISADPSDLLSNPTGIVDGEAVVAGLLVNEITEDGEGGEYLEGVEVKLLDENEELISRTFTDQNGRFMFEEQTRQTRIVEVRTDGNITEQRILIPGEVTQLTITMRAGSGTNNVDLRMESTLQDSVEVGTAVAIFTVITAAIGFGGAMEALRGNSYRRTQWLCGIALFSRGGVFIGPGLILAGMALNRIARRQFEDWNEREE
ncbi:MAG: hypothetical protein CL981_06640 [Euryarchaeota archaeon]|nr:hypothetical protein [Euryarchaeota archaeon]